MKSHTINKYPQIKLKNIIRNILVTLLNRLTQYRIAFTRARPRAGAPSTVQMLCASSFNRAGM